MPRRSLRLAYIVNQSKRKISYQKRKRGVLKKLNELTVLCDVDAAIIMYNSFEHGPVIWSSVEDVQQVIARFMNLSEVQRTRRMMNQESFLLERIEKLSTQLLNLKKDNREREMNELIHRIFTGEKTIDSLSFIELNDLGWVLNTNLAEIVWRVDRIMRDSSTLAPVQTQALFVPGTSNVVAPANLFSGQSYQGTVGMQTPMYPNLNPAWSYQSDPTQGEPAGPSTSQNP